MIFCFSVYSFVLSPHFPNIAAPISVISVLIEILDFSIPFSLTVLKCSCRRDFFRQSAYLIKNSIKVDGSFGCSTRMFPNFSYSFPFHFAKDMIMGNVVQDRYTIATRMLRAHRNGTLVSLNPSASPPAYTLTRGLWARNPLLVIVFA